MFGLNVLVEYEGNLILTDGLVLQDKEVWEEATGRKVLPANNASELYFEERDIENFACKIEELYPESLVARRRL